MENDTSSEYEITLKIILCGDMSVGKTSLFTRYVMNYFPSNSLPTIAVELKSKIIQLKNNKLIKALIWDTAGQEKYKSLISK